MGYGFFHIRPVFFTRIRSAWLRSVGESLMLLMVWAAISILTLVWVLLLIRGLGYIGAALATWL